MTDPIYPPLHLEVLCGSVVECLSRIRGVLSSSGTVSSGFLTGLSLGKTLQRLSQVLVKPREDTNDVSCCHDMTEILLKAA